VRTLSATTPGAAVPPIPALFACLVLLDRLGRHAPGAKLPRDVVSGPKATTMVTPVTGTASNDWSELHAKWPTNRYRRVYVSHWT
jgi:hypothetical protein